MKDKASFFSFILSCLFLAYFWGVITGRYQLFPYPIFEGARKVVDPFLNPDSDTPTVFTQGPDSLHTFPYRDYYSGSGVTLSNKEKAYEGYTLFTAFDGGKCNHFLVDFEGNTVQEWHINFSEVWSKDAPFLKEQFGDEWTCWQGTHLSSDGTLVATFMDIGRPYCGGLVSLNLDSEVVWSLPKCTHHDVHLGEDGLIYAPGMILVEAEEGEGGDNISERYIEPEDTPSEPSKTVFWKAPLLKDTVVVASQDGELQEEFPLLEAFFNSEYRWSLSTQFNAARAAYGDRDPTHLNDVELVTEAWAKHHPKVEAGDIMLSVRNMNAIAILDRDTKNINWLTSGPFARQHDPDLLPNGNILIFDNWGTSGSETGATRVMEWDPKTQTIVWEYGGTRERPLHASFRGSQQPLPNGNVLITESTGGRILEVTRNGEIVWEYINQLSDDRVGVVIRAQRFAPDSLDFVK